MADNHTDTRQMPGDSQEPEDADEQRIQNDGATVDIDLLEDSVTHADNSEIKLCDDDRSSFSPAAPYKPTTQHAPHTLANECRRTLFSAKRKLSFHHINDSPCEISSDVSETEARTANFFSEEHSNSNQSSEVVSESTASPSFIETDSLQESGHIHLPSNSGGRTLAPSMAVSPLIKSFKAFDIHPSQQALDISPSSFTSHATSMLIPSFSFPCLLSPHPITQLFTLELPTHCHMSQSPVVVPSKSTSTIPSRTPSVVQYKSSSRTSPKSLSPVPSKPYSALTSKSSETTVAPTFSSESISAKGNGHSLYETLQTQDISLKHRVTQDIIYTSPTTSSTSSVFSDLTLPACSSQLKSVGGKSSPSSVGAKMKLHKQLSVNETRAAKSTRNNSQSRLKAAQSKQAFLHGSSEHQVQQKNQSSLRCPRKVHCNNCGHTIDLENYLQPLQPSNIGGCSRNNAGRSSPSGKSAPSKFNVTNIGLTVFDLENICNTGCIDGNSPVSIVAECGSYEKQIESVGAEECMFLGGAIESSNNTSRHDIVRSPNVGEIRLKSHGAFSKFGIQCYETAMPTFPHSDELTKSFAPIFSELNEKNPRLAESWEKLDLLDIDEMLQLLEATSDVLYCNKNDPVISNRTKEASDISICGNEQQPADSVLPASHIITETAYCINRPCDHACVESTYNIRGKTSQDGKHGEKLDGVGSYAPGDVNDDQTSICIDPNSDLHMCKSSSLSDECTLSVYSLTQGKTSQGIESGSEERVGENVEEIASSSSTSSTTKSDSEGDVHSEKNCGRVLRSHVKHHRASRICKKRPRKRQSQKSKGKKI